MEALTHWDDLEVEHNELGPMDARWQSVSSPTVGMSRIRVAADRQSTPAHSHAAAEELFFVLAGDGLWWEDGSTTRIAAGDVILAPPRGPAHTIVGGREGIDVLAFGPRIDVEVVHLPRPGVVRVGGVTLPARTRHQWLFEADVGPVERSAPGARPAHCVALQDVELDEVRHGPTQLACRPLDAAVGATRTRLTWVRIDAGARSWPLHCHSAETELFVVLAGRGQLRLGDALHTVRAGSVVSRPAGTGVAHQFLAGDEPLELLAYSDHRTEDMAYFPDSRKVNFRGLGLIARVEPVGYWDGEA